MLMPVGASFVMSDFLKFGDITLDFLDEKCFPLRRAVRLLWTHSIFHHYYTTLKFVMEPSNIIPFDQPKPTSRYPAKSMKSSLLVKAAEVIEDPQILVNVVSQRVAQLNQGRAPLIETVPSMGAADIALTEIIEGKVIVSEPKGE